MYKLRTQFDFDSAHRLVGYSGKCHQLHGHIWTVILEISGEKKDLDKIGILWDFTNVKKLKDYFDHKTILKNCDENEVLIAALISTCGRESVVLMKDNPTAENLCGEVLKKIKTSNPNLKYKITIYESPKSCVEIEE